MKKFKQFYYFQNGRRIQIYVEVCDTLWKKFRGLMFRKKSYPLLFTFNKNKKLDIHSFFCVPFRAVWIDDNRNVTREELIKKWKPHFSGHGKYLLEVPLSTEKVITKK